MPGTFLKTGLAVLPVVLLAACGTQPRYQNSIAYDDSYRYDTASSYRNRCEICGTVKRIERVQLHDESSQGTGGGAALGVTIGGVIGHQVQKDNNDRRHHRDGYRVEVSLDDGRWAQVTQLANPRLRVGNRVMIRDYQVFRLR